MKITELTKQRAQTSAEQLLTQQALRQRSVVVAFVAETPEEQQKLAPVLRRFNVVYVADHERNLAILDFNALAALEAEFSKVFDDAATQALASIQRAHQVVWQAGDFHFDLTTKGLVYAILNTTPDSFYDGGQYFDEIAVREHVAEILAHGADVIEVGGQSTRPGYTEISSQAEIDRIMPYIKLIQNEFPEAVIAVDTYKPVVMEAALDAGVSIINDINGFVDDPVKIDLMRQSNVGMVSMLNRRLMDEPITYDTVMAVFRDQLQQFKAAGIDLNRVALDPGVGFSTVGNLHNDLALIHGISQLNDFQLPVMAAVSNKSYLKKLLDLEKDDRVMMSVVTEALMYEQGNQIIRVHNVEETDQMRRLIDNIHESYLA
ncbi:dihydropteroate synthase [Weissella uvarum]|uniref:dihydropteroate synthase n=1 Tax=Weissella uvarum TaxID=1479233 RepID=UPI00195FC5C8|nr:dihydropteroate synthase [Weissella uvarum]MBM7616541.1 dihydropteroate synthase [Weissella uvarum]MCM0594999.1 dihydropteroate synthase [Weissella uvarum]